MQKQKLIIAKNYIKLMLVMLCSFVGVGFVSGAEIYEFFVRFSPWFFIGFLVFFMLCFMLTYKIICLVYNSNSCNFKSDIITINNKFKLHKRLYKSDIFTNKTKYHIREIVVFLNVLLISGAMFSGLKNLLLNLFFNNYFLLLILCFFMCFLVTLFGVKGLEKIDIFVLVFVCFIIVVFVLDKSFDLKTIFSASECEEFVLNNSNNYGGFELGIFSLFFAGLYVFMNILQFQPLIQESGILFKKRIALWFSLSFSIILSIILLVLILFLNKNLSLAVNSMPFLSYFIEKGKVYGKVFAFGLIICLVSTLITCLIGVKKGIVDFLKSSNFVATAMALTLAVLISVIPFKVYVSIVYPILGAINFVFFVIN